MTYAQTFAALGKARLEILAQVRSREDFERLWKVPEQATAPVWGDCWKACVEFGVPDRDAEVGFYIEVLDFGINAAWDDRVMLMSPDGAYSFTVYTDTQATPAQTLNMQFMVANIAAINAAMKAQQIPYTQELQKVWGEKSPMKTIIVRTPNGISLTVWGNDP